MQMLMPMVLNESSSTLLTPRELEVLNLIARGLTAKLIARYLGISVNTVRTHRDNLRRKLGARNTAHLGFLHAALTSGRATSVDSGHVLQSAER
ncbi:MAG: helix-turn-helix transcriptional regulator [Gammaproteobacteria bacterium]|nr:helix-turn-helix transcriptional regulator [Gammaproteobacteria bacterium]MBU1443178.1 helix-turn-helix transcriptional regulator [Gammaproteobacteria bacterium]MBU2285955.1 helix-turn-helix transcriptional regulator [Gammaproteobacteria bacterium]MBU2409674.1 helix-turn-helix transcriptional regulator [Gammaproteobacteria bacterium]